MDNITKFVDMLSLQEKKEDKKLIYKNINVLHCSNCGKNGHHYHNCRDPITSIGIICFKIDDVPFDTIKNIFEDLVFTSDTKYSTELVQLKHVFGIQLNKLLTDSEFEYKSLGISEDLVKNFIKYKDNIKFLLVQRKYSLGYIVFMKGKWKINDKEELITLFSQMTLSEINGLKKCATDCSCNKDKLCASDEEFKKLWNDFWVYNNDRNIINYTTKREREYDIIRNKINVLVHISLWNLEYYCNIVKVNSNVPEWGFPKGKRHNKETNIDCAIREFKEETGVNSTTFNTLNRIKEIKEDMVGTNMQIYRHLYYISYTDNNVELKHDPVNISAHKSEIGNLAWFNYTDALCIINQKHSQKIHILTRIYLFIANRLIKQKLK